MYYTVYKITNLVNNKIYVGVHKTSNLEDGYMGSGKLIKLAIEKYGLENFTKEYLAIFDNTEEMFNMESMLVNEEFIKRDDTYNLKEGGFGGFDFINSNYRHSDIFLKSISPFGKEFSEKYRDIIVKSGLKGIDKIKNMRINNEITVKSFKGKKHTDETKNKIGEANSKHQQGEGNSQFGTMWIHNLDLKVSKKIRKDEFSTWELDGWLKGRKINFF